ncbi:MAG: DNA polymerase III subunit chi [Gammaproteobacteria bacterium]|nr:DNA polymerase III subunit chi [Gammaproteobacteria bacterium]
MEQVDFYLLGPVDETTRLTTACRIANKAYERRMRIYLQTADREQSELLDKLLWTFSQESFVPHTLRNSLTDWKQYPVQIGVGDSGVAGLDLLISLQAAVPADAEKYKRVADLVMDNTEQKQLGRARFRYYREKGVEPKTHQL